MEPQESTRRREQALNRDLLLATAPFRVMDQSSVQFANRVTAAPTAANTRRRAMSEEAAPPAAGQRRRLSPVSNPPSLPMFPQLQSNPVPSLYSTGLLETPVRNLQEGRNQMTSTPLGGQTLHGQSSNQSSAPLRSPLHAMLGRVNRHANLLQDKVDAYVRQKEEIFRKAHVERWQALFQIFEAEAARTIRAKDEELAQLTSRCVELADELARKNAESASWKAQATSELSNSIRLRTLLERLVTAQATAPAESCGSGGAPAAAGDGVEDAESVQIGSEPTLPGSCLVCRRRRATVLMLPCRCLSLCSDCCQARDGAAPCPNCDGVMKARINVVIP